MTIIILYDLPNASKIGLESRILCSILKPGASELQKKKIKALMRMSKAHNRITIQHYNDIANDHVWFCQ